MDEDSNAWFDESPIPAEALAPQATRRGPVSEEAIAGMDWPTLQAAVKTCTRCNLCQTRETAVHGRGDEQAEWLVVAAAPTADDEADDYAMTGKPGYLLDGMLRAVNQSTEKGAYITTLVKCRPADGQPSEEQLQACRPYLDRELQLSGAKVVVALGHVAGKGLLGAAARGRIMLYQDIPVVATYHPANLLQQPEDKAKAWADLCLAKSAHAGRR